MLRSDMTAALCWAAALAAPAVALPAEEDPAVWREALAFAGLEIAADGELVLAEHDGAWQLCAGARCVETPAPLREEDREAIALLARSLVRELEMPRGPAPAPTAPRLRVELADAARVEAAPVELEAEPLVGAWWQAPEGPARAEVRSRSLRVWTGVGAATWQGEAPAGAAEVGAWLELGSVLVLGSAQGTTAAGLQSDGERSAARLGAELGGGLVGPRVDAAFVGGIDRETWRQAGEEVTTLALPRVGVRSGVRRPLGDRITVRLVASVDVSLRDVELATEAGTFAQRGRAGAGLQLGLLVGSP